MSRLGIQRSRLWAVAAPLLAATLMASLPAGSPTTVPATDARTVAIAPDGCLVDVIWCQHGGNG
jgi:hypothetical protein